MAKREQVEKERREKGGQECLPNWFLPNSIAATRWSMVVGERRNHGAESSCPGFLPLERLSHLVPCFNRFSIFRTENPSPKRNYIFLESCQIFSVSIHVPIIFQVLRFSNELLFYISGVYELRITTNGNCLLIKITSNIDLDKYDIK